MWGHGVEVARSVCTNAAAGAGICILQFGFRCHLGWLACGSLSEGRESGRMKD